LLAYFRAIYDKTLVVGEPRSHTGATSAQVATLPLTEGKPMTMLTAEYVLDACRTMLKHTTYCFLVTQGKEGWCSARLVQPILDNIDDFVLWFGTNPHLRKVREIEANPRATVAIANDGEHANLVLYGTVTIEKDVPTRERQWLTSWQPFFPGGPAGQLYVVLRFETERMEVLNFKRNIAPDPYGLCPAVLVRDSGSWTLKNVG
jgi:general stress protein 26